MTAEAVATELAACSYPTGPSWPPQTLNGKPIPAICGLVCAVGKRYCPRHEMIAEAARVIEANKQADRGRRKGRGGR